jgi:anti-sigma-K factor RskA
MTGDHELHTLAGPYVMDAVTPQERSRFARHLDDCSQCRDDVREMREATARLGMAAVVRPRPELKEQTIRAAFRTSQLAPLVDGPVVEGPVVDSPEADRPVVVSTAPADPDRAAVPRWRRAAWRGRSIRLPAKFALASAAVVAAAAIGFGVAANNVMEQLHHTQRQDHMIASVLAARDAVMLTARITTGGTATVVMSHHQRRLVFTTHGLRPLPSGWGYELWLMGPAGDRSAGMLRFEADGMTDPTVVSGLRHGDAIGVTVEPAGGSPLPSSSLVVMIKQRG